MRKLFGIVSLAMLAATSVAQAADAIDTIPEAPVAIETTYDWSGLYIGAFGGYGWGNLDVDGTDSFDLDGGLAGGHIGYNFQNGAWVFGLESEIAWSGLSDDLSIPGVDAGVDLDNTWLGSTTGRVGYAMDRFLVYGKAGVAYGEVEVNGTGLLDGLSANDTNVGWTAGAGVEYAFTENLIGRMEYQYYDLGTFFGDDGIPDADFDAHTIKAAVSFKF